MVWRRDERLRPRFRGSGKSKQGDRSIFGFSPISLPCIHSPSSYIYLVLCPPKKWGMLELQGSEGEGPCSHWSKWEKGDEQHQLAGPGLGRQGNVGWPEKGTNWEVRTGWKAVRGHAAEPRFPLGMRG